MMEINSDCISVAHLSSESGDHYLEVWEGNLDAEKGAWDKAIKERFGEEAENIYLKQFEVIKMNGQIW